MSPTMSTLLRLLFLFVLILVSLSACASDTGILGGGTWQLAALPHQHIRVLEVDPNDPQEIYAGDDKGNIFISTDAARHWTPHSLGTTSPDSIHTLAFDNAGKKLYAATDQGLFVSTDGGLHWQHVGSSGSSATNLPIDSSTTFAFDINNPSVIYVGTAQHGVYASIDGRASWTWASDGLPANVPVNGLSFDADQHQLWAATSVGVYRSDNRGTSWRSFNTGFPPNVVINTV